MIILGKISIFKSDLLKVFHKNPLFFSLFKSHKSTITILMIYI